MAQKPPRQPEKAYQFRGMSAELLKHFSVISSTLKIYRLTLCKFNQSLKGKKKKKEEKKEEEEENWRLSMHPRLLTDVTGGIGAITAFRNKIR
jgi:hypothetical protein